MHQSRLLNLLQRLMQLLDKEDYIKIVACFLLKPATMCKPSPVRMRLQILKFQLKRQFHVLLSLVQIKELNLYKHQCHFHQNKA